MSRVGKKPILIPQGVEVKIIGREVIAKGPKGELKEKIQPKIKLTIEGGYIVVAPEYESQKIKAIWGLNRALIANIIQGVSEGYEKKLQVEGVGYRANMDGDDLGLQLGFSHPVGMKKQAGIDFRVEKNIITVSGIDKGKVGQIAAKIRAIRPPEPYKGKGIRYVGEVVRRKEGKKAVGAGK
ncbi:MAG: 50S ribosomal protein L6 [Patescibacteria group bacterium]